MITLALRRGVSLQTPGYPRAVPWVLSLGERLAVSRRLWFRYGIITLIHLFDKILTSRLIRLASWQTFSWYTTGGGDALLRYCPHSLPLRKSPAYTMISFIDWYSFSFFPGTFSENRLRPPWVKGNDLIKLMMIANMIWPRNCISMCKGGVEVGVHLTSLRCRVHLTDGVHGKDPSYWLVFIYQYLQTFGHLNEAFYRPQTILAEQAADPPSYPAPKIYIIVFTNNY